MASPAPQPIFPAVFPGVKAQPPYRPALRATALAGVDLLSLSAAILAGYALYLPFNPAIPGPHVLNFLAAPFCVVAFASESLYPGIGMTAVENGRRMFKALTFTYLLVMAALFLSKTASLSSRGMVFTSWLLSLLLVPLGRWLLSSCFRDQNWWTAPVLILGAGRTASLLIRNISSNRVLGYRPVGCLDDDPGKHGSCEGVPVLGPLSQAHHWAACLGVEYAIVAMPGVARERLLVHLRGWSQIFRTLLIVPDLFGVASLWTAPRDLGGVLGLEIRHNHLNGFHRYLKRAADIVGSAIGLAVAAPALLVAVVWIKRISPGPALYRHEREGKNGRVFQVMKLRTMFPESETLLEGILERNSQARHEWTTYCKLRNDPRILPGVGAFLRRTSLDEVPQLWNVLKGEMSLVGPRPFPRYHNEMFDPDFRSLRTQVTPGLTGLWQVSGRSDGDLEAQAFLDSYYIHNWSLWLDLYIVFRTVRAVLALKGAY